jgi:hypothetical protein
MSLKRTREDNCQQVSLTVGGLLIWIESFRSVPAWTNVA